MATQKYYIDVEEKVLDLHKQIESLEATLNGEMALSGNGLLYPENYDVQGTLKVNMQVLVNHLNRTVKLIEENASRKWGTRGA